MQSNFLKRSIKITTWAEEKGQEKFWGVEILILRTHAGHNQNASY
jgi:hypothetical protein